MQQGAKIRLVTKGAFGHVLDVCTTAADARPLNDAVRASLRAQYERWSQQGIRVVAVATRALGPQADYGTDDEREMTFAGFVTFLDRPSEGVTEALEALSRLGIAFKLITGDNGLVTRHVATLVGLRADRMLRGEEIDALDGPAFGHAVERTDLFVEVDPRQKERIIRSLRARGHVVGFLGDGVNDTPAMHAADTSLAVDRAVDVAREAADFVLLEHGLDVIRRGVEEGRRTFANTLKYILITTSANLGNMISMAAASLVLPFLPLLPAQILLNNLLSDVPAVGLADDNVDPELVARPRRWDITFIGRFMVAFGLVSSAFDVVTFVLLRLVFDAQPELFRTAWFVESLLTELVIALVVRTSRPALSSRPGRLLVQTTAAMIAAALVVPFLPFAGVLGFVPLPVAVVGAVIAITGAYVVATERLKRPFFRHR